MQRTQASRIILGVMMAAIVGAAQAFGADSLVRRKCATCHPPTPDGRISRVEDVRTTPEEWTVIVDRMRRLHGMPLRNGEMGALLKELSTTQILSPDEQARVSYLSLWHNAQRSEAPADKDEERLFAVCVRCHSAGKILSYRMTRDHWARLRDFHLYSVPTVVQQMREMHWIDEADAVLSHLADKLPYGKPWVAPSPALEGDWSVFGYQPGRGTYRGNVRIDGKGDAEFRLGGSLSHADGVSETFAGDATLYGGYALRTRTRNNGLAANGAYIVSNDEVRGEHHFPAPDFRTSSATWLRKTGQPRIARTLPRYLLKGETTTLTIEGIDLPDVAAADIAIANRAVRVLSVTRVSPEVIELRAASSADALVEAKFVVKGLDAGTLWLAPRIDYIAVTPGIGRARLSGGRNYPAEGVQFEAIAYAKRGRGNPSADVALGPVPATFRLAEERSRPGDDDLRWLGEILPNGAYLPVGDYGPNPARKYLAENSGLVKVLAEYRRGPRAFRAQAKLAVTMPDFIQRIR